MRILALMSLVCLAACGADVMPVTPAKPEAKPGVTISGQARIGVVTCVKGPGC